MALIRRRVTARMIAANRRNARKGTGPRTARGKAQSRLNGLRSGFYSRLFLNYFQLWLDSLMWDPRVPPPWEFSKMPRPFYPRPGHDPWEARRVRELLLSITAYPQPAPRARAARRERRKLNNLFRVPETVKLLKTQEGQQKRTRFQAQTNW